MKRYGLLLGLWLWGTMALSAHAAPIALGGQVLDDDGKPLRGASVALVPVPSRFAAGELRLQGKTGPEPAARTASDAEGRFELSAPAPGMWEVQVTARGFVPRRFSLLPLLEPMELPALEMGPEVPLRVRVVDPQGRPVAGARVAANTGDAPGFGPTWWLLPQLVTTGPDGAATVSRWKGVPLELEATAPGYPPASIDIDARESAAELRLAAACPRTLQISAKGKAGDPLPVAGALAVRESWTLGVTGDDGRVTVAAPCDKPLRIAVATRDGRLAKVTLRPGKADQPVAVTLPAEPVRVAGRVLENETRAAVAGAFVWAGDDPAGFVRTDAKGAYTLTLAGEEAVAVGADAVGYLAGSDQARSGTAGPVFLLTPLAAASGVVVDAAGRPVAGAQVRATADDPSRGGFGNPFLSVRSNAKGEFRLPVLSGEDLTLSASHPDFVTGRLAVPGLAPHASRSGLRIVLDAGLSAFGKVVDAAGEPVAGAEVWLLPSVDGREGFAAFRNLERLPSPAVTDARGVFTLDHLQPGRMDLHAGARGFAPTRVRGLALAAPAAGSTGAAGPVDLGTVTLGAGATLEGVVVDPQDRPVAGATVELLGTASPIPWGGLGSGEEELLTAADGTFSLPGVPPGERVTVSVTRRGYAPASFRDLQAPTAEPLRIVLTPGSRVAGHVVDEAGEPVAGAMVGLFRVGAQSLGNLTMAEHAGMEQTGSDGEFAAEAVTPGKIRVAAGAPGYLRAEIPAVEVVAGRDIEGLELVLRRGAVVTGRVLSPDGEPMPGAWVQAVDDTEEYEALPSFQGAIADAEGRYRLEGVPEGAVRSFAAQAEGFQRTVKDLEVRRGENRLDFRLDAGHEVAGRVVDAGGAPVSGAAVSLTEPGTPFLGSDLGWGKGSRTGADGSFRLTGVPTGVYEVQAAKDGYAPGRLDAVEVAGPVRGLEVRLAAAGSIHGRLTGVDLAELAGAEVSAQPLADGTAPSYASSRVDYQGQYRLDGLGAGEWYVAAQTSSGLRATGKITLAPGGDAELDLELGGGFTLTGRVLRGGEPVLEAWVVVFATDGGDGHGFASTGPQGVFRIAGLQAGSYRLSVSNLYGLSHDEEVEISGDRDLQVEIAGQRVSGRVVDATDQSAVPYALVSLQETEGTSGPFREKAVRTDDKGAFVLTDVAPGSYRVQVQVEGYAATSSPVAVGDAAVDGVVLELQPTEGLVLEVRGALGSPPPQVQVAFLDSTGRVILNGTHTTGENGRVRITSAPSGGWQILVTATGYATIEQTVQVPSPPVTVTLPRPSTLTVAAPGLPDGAVVTLIGAGGRPFRALLWNLQQEWLLQNGQAEITGLPPGRWQVRVTAPEGQQTWQAEVTTTAGSPARVVVR